MSAKKLPQTFTVSFIKNDFINVDYTNIYDCSLCRAVKRYLKANGFKYEKKSVDVALFFVTIKIKDNFAFYLAVENWGYAKFRELQEEFKKNPKYEYSLNLTLKYR